MAALKKTSELRTPDDDPVKCKTSIKPKTGCIDRFMCDICGQENLSDTDMKSHILLQHVENQISCPFCDLEGTTFEDMTLHVNSQHIDLLTPSREGCRVDDFLVRGDAAAEDQVVAMDTTEDESNRTSGKHQISDGCSALSDCPLAPTSPSTNTCDNNTTPKRARLRLEVPVITVDKPISPAKGTESKKPPSLPNYSCPLCGWGTDTSEKITQHVNVAHLDALTPTKPSAKLGGCDWVNNNIEQSPLECPLCVWTTCDATALERHVHEIHCEDLRSPDLLSPDSLSSPLWSCPVCAMECNDAAGLQRHVEGHFSGTHTPGSDQDMCDSTLAKELQQIEQSEASKKEKEEFDQLQDQYGMKGNNNYKKQLQKNMEQAVSKGQMSITDFYIKRHEAFEADRSGVDDGQSCTRGIIEALHKYYKTTATGVNRYWLCSSAEHYASTYGDKGWGCGYRNLQMQLSSLAKCDLYEQVLFNGRPVVPSISKIQRLIETAWQKGFDRAGCEQLGGQVTNTSKWIGATEIVATLSSLKIKCQLVDFHIPTGPSSTHPHLLMWVRDYFKNSDKFKPPLYLQHQGHSRTIIGIEEIKDSALRLLLFDPSCRKPQMSQFLHEITANLMRTLRRPVHTLKAKQYQIVAVQGVLNDKEFQESKMLKSEQIP